MLYFYIFYKYKLRSPSLKIIHSNSNSPKQLFTTSIHTSRTIIQDLQILPGFNFGLKIFGEEGILLPSIDEGYDYGGERVVGFCQVFQLLPGFNFGVPSWWETRGFYYQVLISVPPPPEKYFYLLVAVIVMDTYLMLL